MSMEMLGICQTIGTASGNQMDVDVIPQADISMIAAPKGTYRLPVHRLDVQRLSLRLELLRLMSEHLAKAVSPSPRVCVCWKWP
jgi:hypothetical protein